MNSQQNELKGPSIETLQAEARANRQAAVNILIEACLEVDCEIPRVLKGKFGEEAN